MSDTVNPEHDELAKSVGITVQPPPRPTNSPSAHDLLNSYIKQQGFRSPPVDFSLVDFGIKNLAITYLVSYFESTDRDLTEEIEKRKEFGLKKYGTTLTADNGRDHLEDASQELIDFLVYYICDEQTKSQTY